MVRVIEQYCLYVGMSFFDLVTALLSVFIPI